MRSIAVILSACLLNCAFALPAPAVESGSTHFLEREIKFDGSANWPRVVGGSTASSGQFPYMVSLRRSNSHFCGASIISGIYILTAAHCTNGANPESITAVVGTTTLNSGGIGYGLSRIIIHEAYNTDNSANDISILQTSSPIGGSNEVASIALNAAYIDSGVPVVLSGWGGYYSGSPLPNELQYVNLRSISHQECTDRLYPNAILETALCTFTQSGEGACNGDSGGPLAFSGVLVGIVSYGIPCAVGYPDVFTRVSSYVDWILANAT